MSSLHRTPSMAVATSRACPSGSRGSNTVWPHKRKNMPNCFKAWAYPATTRPTCWRRWGCWRISQPMRGLNSCVEEVLGGETVTAADRISDIEKSDVGSMSAMSPTTTTDTLREIRCRHGCRQRIFPLSGVRRYGGKNYLMWSRLRGLVGGGVADRQLGRSP